MPACRRRRTSPLLQGPSSRFDLHQLPWGQRSSSVHDDASPLVEAERKGNVAQIAAQRQVRHSAGVHLSAANGRQSGGRTTGCARPVWFFTDHVLLAFEAGFDHTSSGAGLYDGWLRKFTLAPQIGAGRKFFSRLVLRAFVTYANWSQGLEGFVGGEAFKNKTFGWNVGVQGETWW